ncbi:MAG TPA: serine hydrolase domain-containing protein [Gemmatimonadaceae bacterium]|nr:serine hydrolase domain-containing protein [Gemmatimonadaceae bacterium]
MHKRFLVMAFVAAVLSAPLPLEAQTAARARHVAASSTVPAKSALRAQIDSVVRSYLAGGKAAGMSVAVMRGRDTLALKGYGYADLEFDVHTPDHAVYEIGSVTKQFTASAILLLQERGKLSLDDPLTQYLPGYPAQGHTVTLRRLLDHTSGIKGYTELPEFGLFMMRHVARDSLVALFSSKPFDFAPGDAQVYNNSAYFLLGLIIEKTSGLSYADFVKKNLFEPAGMTDSRYCSESAIFKRRAHGYDTGPDGLRRAAYLDHLWPFAAGSLCSSAADLVSWNRALHGGRILSAASYKELTTPGTLNDGTRLRYAKGIAVHSVAGHRVIEHGGGINGFLSASDYFPDDDAIIVVLINTAGPVSPDAVVASLADLVLGRKTLASMLYAGDLTHLTGTYSGVGRGRETRLLVAADRGSLSFKPDRGGAPKRRARYVGENTFMVDDTRYTFLGGGDSPPRLRVDAVYGLSVFDRK